MLHDGQFAEILKRRAIRQLDAPPKGASVDSRHVVAGDEINEETRLASLMYE